jgi:hypothetical protein
MLLRLPPKSSDTKSDTSVEKMLVAIWLKLIMLSPWMIPRVIPPDATDTHHRISRSFLLDIVVSYHPAGWPGRR